MASRGSEKGVDPTIACDLCSDVKRGGSVDLVLEAIPNFGNVITFEIQSRPLHGTLSNPVQLTDHTARVTYHHDGSKDPKDDSFTFRAATVGRAKSSPATVNLAILPPPARLECDPSSLDFGEVFLSEKKQMMVKVTNKGGVTARGRMILPVGFTAPAADVITLGENESIDVMLEFSPMEEKQFSEPVSFASLSQKRTLLLKGGGRSRFHAAKTGSASCELKNLSTSPIMISFTGGEGWELPQSVQLPAESRKTITFQPSPSIGSGVALAKSSHLHLSDGLSSMEMELPSPDSIAPVTVERVSSESLGNIPSGSNQRIAFRLGNRSDGSKKLRWSLASSSGGGSTIPSAAELSPGESREILFDWRPARLGKARLILSVAEGSRTQDVAWNALIVAPPPPKQDVAMQGKDPSESSEEHPTMEYPEAATIPPVAGAAWEINTPWFGAPRILMSWPLVGKESGSMELEENHVVMLSNAPVLPGKTALRLEPVQFHDLKKSIQGRREFVMLPPLGEGWHLILLSKLSPTGQTEEFSQFQIEVPNTASWLVRMRWPMGILLIVSLGGFLIRLKNKGF